MTRLGEALKEEARRLLQVNDRKKTKTPKKKAPKTFFETWKREREDWFRYYRENPAFEAPGGEVANIYDYLTPTGYDREGRKVGFIESARKTGPPLVSDAKKNEPF